MQKVEEIQFMEKEMEFLEEVTLFKAEKMKLKESEMVFMEFKMKSGVNTTMLKENPIV